MGTQIVGTSKGGSGTGRHRWRGRATQRQCHTKHLLRSHGSSVSGLSLGTCAWGSDPHDYSRDGHMLDHAVSVTSLWLPVHKVTV